MWWEWAIVILVVGVALAWASRRIYVKLAVGGRSACDGCKCVDQSDKLRSDPVELKIDTR
jgi:hypothetical protein